MLPGSAEYSSNSSSDDIDSASSDGDTDNANSDDDIPTRNFLAPMNQLQWKRRQYKKLS